MGILHCRAPWSANPRPLNIFTAGFAIYHPNILDGAKVEKFSIVPRLKQAIAEKKWKESYTTESGMMWAPPNASVPYSKNSEIRMVFSPIWREPYDPAKKARPPAQMHPPHRPPHL